MKKYIGSGSVALVALLMTQWAAAGEFSVGRAEVVLPQDEWRVFALTDEAIHYSGDISGDIKLEKKVFVKTSATKALEAIAVVSSTPGGISHGHLSYSPSCPGGEQFFARGNAGFNQSHAECWQVFQKFNAESVLEGLAPGVQALLSKENIALPVSLQAMTSYYGNSNGTTLGVSLLLAPAVQGRQGQANYKIPEKFDPAFVLLGQELAEAVRGSVTSIRGKLVMPSLEIKK